MYVVNWTTLIRRAVKASMVPREPSGPILTCTISVAFFRTSGVETSRTSDAVPVAYLLTPETVMYRPYDIPQPCSSLYKIGLHYAQ